TVLVNGAARRSCVTPVGSIEGNEVTTLEGLGTLDKPHPLQKAFIDEQAAQCGYCASGMIMAAADLLNRNPQPQEADVRAALAQIAAEELEVPLGRVTMISGDTGRTPNEGQTAGSQSIEQSGTALRMAGAEVRALLIGLAARKLGVSADTLKVTDGVIHAPDGRKVGYGELTAETDLKREATAKVPPKPAAQYKIVGKSAPRIDIPAKMTGGAAFVQDLPIPGMVHGS